MDSSFGEVSRCQIPHKAGVPRGIGFVEFKRKEDALHAIETLDGKKVTSFIDMNVPRTVGNVRFFSLASLPLPSCCPFKAQVSSAGESAFQLPTRT